MSLLPYSHSPGLQLSSTTSSTPEPFCIISTDAGEENPNKLFLGGIPPHATEEQLLKFFSQFGAVRDVRIVTDRITAECKGYGFVTFDDGEDIEHLVEMKTIRMSGKKLRVRKAVRRNGSQFDEVNKSPPGSEVKERGVDVGVPLKDSSAPITIPTGCVTKTPPMLPPPVPFTPLTPHTPHTPIDQFFNFSPSQIIVSPPLPDVELLGQQFPQMSPISAPGPPWMCPNQPVIYFPNLSYPPPPPNHNWNMF